LFFRLRKRERGQFDSDQLAPQKGKIMANFDSLKSVVNDSKATLASAAKTIRALIQQRNTALAASDPVTVKAMQDETIVESQAKQLQGELELQRQDTEEAITEANAEPVLPPKPAVQPPPATGQIEIVYYADGTSATGVAPLPRVAPSGAPAVPGPVSPTKTPTTAAALQPLVK
jgi:hypothetical protein